MSLNGAKHIASARSALQPCVSVIVMWGTKEFTNLTDRQTDRWTFE